MSNGDVAVVTVADRGFLPAACCQLISTANHLEGDSRVQLFMVTCDVSDDEISKADQFFKKRGMSVEIIVPDFLDTVVTLPGIRWGLPTYLRLYLDRIFDSRWKRVIYFDADTKVCKPLSPLLLADLRGRPIGAVHDYIFYVTGNIHKRRHDLLLADDAPYFQSGVMVFDWPAMMASDGLAAEHPEACSRAPDQDALNGTFQNRWTALDPRWNLHHLYLMYGGKLQPSICHFTTTKPWSRKRPRAWRRFADWYRYELADSPWPKFVEPQNLWQAMRADRKFAQKTYAPRIRETVARYLPSLAKRLNWGHTLSDKFAQKPWVPRRSRDVEDMVRALIMEAEGRCPPLRPPESVLVNGHW